MSEKPLRLFVVTFSAEMVVVAEDAEGAREAADDARSEMSDRDYDIQAETMRHLPEDWGMESIPFGARAQDDAERSVARWIELGAAPEYVELKARLNAAKEKKS